jgi:hypothetical protein
MVPAGTVQAPVPPTGSLKASKRLTLRLQVLDVLLVDLLSDPRMHIRPPTSSVYESRIVS